MCASLLKEASLRQAQWKSGSLTLQDHDVIFRSENLRDIGSSYYKPHATPRNSCRLPPPSERSDFLADVHFPFRERCAHIQWQRPVMATQSVEGIATALCIFCAHVASHLTAARGRRTTCRTARRRATAATSIRYFIGSARTNEQKRVFAALTAAVTSAAA